MKVSTNMSPAGPGRDGGPVAQLLHAGDDDAVAGAQTAEHHVGVADDRTEVDGALPRDRPPSCFGHEDEVCPLTRDTASTGTVSAGSRLQTMRARMSWSTRVPVGTSRRVALASTLCVLSSALGATNVMGLLATTRPSLSSSSTGRPSARPVARSSGTSTYT